MRRRWIQIAVIVIAVLIASQVVNPGWLMSSDAELESANASGREFGDKYGFPILAGVLILIAFAIISAIRRKRDRHQ